MIALEIANWGAPRRARKTCPLILSTPPKGKLKRYEKRNEQNVFTQRFCSRKWEPYLRIQDHHDTQKSNNK